LPSVLAITVLLTSSLVLGRSGFASFETLTESWQEAEAQSIERLQSDIGIASAVRIGDDVTVTVQNNGETPVVDFSKVDVVVQYTSAGAAYVKYLPFTTTIPVPDDAWGVVTILNDTVEPRILNAGETLTMQVRLNPAPDTASNWLQVTTEQGSSASATFD
jgi:archaellum component FlaF (FlaF/FlaG flagellin family)